MDEFDQGRAFLDEVLAYPDDDAPRLIYADFLEELGDPRGEFIRLQCELARLDELDARYLDVSHRCDELLLEHRDHWSAELKQDVRKAEFARGFIDKITVRARAFIKEADALYRSTPVNWLRFNYVKGAGPQLAATEALSHVRSLDLSGLSIPESDLTALLMSAFLVNLEALHLTHYDISFSDSVGATLGEMPSAKSLRHLEVPGGATFLTAMASSGGGFPKLEHLAVGSYSSENDLAALAPLKVPSLQSLRIRGTLTVGETEAIAEMPVAQLKRLDLGSTRVPGRGLQKLAERGAFDEIVELSLAGCGLGLVGLGALLRRDQLRHCRSLNLSSRQEDRQTGRSSQLVEKLAAHKPLQELKRLHLSGLSPSDVRVLACAVPFGRLELLELETSQLDVHDLVALAESPISQSLRSLKLVGCDMDPAAVRRLATAPMFPNLLRLDLSSGFDVLSFLEEENVIKLVTSPAFPNLQAIKLDFLRVSAKTLNALAENAELPELRQISFCHNRGSRKSIDAVMNSPRLPKLAKLVLTGASGIGDREKLIQQYGSRVRF